MKNLALTFFAFLGCAEQLVVAAPAVTNAVTVTVTSTATVTPELVPSVTLTNKCTDVVTVMHSHREETVTVTHTETLTVDVPETAKPNVPITVTKTVTETVTPYDDATVTLTKTRTFTFTAPTATGLHHHHHHHHHHQHPGHHEPRPKVCLDPIKVKEAEHAKAEADRLNEIAEAAKKRLESLREASARARADPHYVYQAVSPYQVIGGAQKDYDTKKAAADAAAAKAAAAANEASAHVCDEAQQPSKGCHGPEYEAAKAEADRLATIAEAAKNRLESLREASARARADPHYVYQAVSPYQVIGGAEKDYKSKQAAADAAAAKAKEACHSGGPRPPTSRCAYPNTLAGREAVRLWAEVERLRNIANAAEKRLRSLREAAARARSDPHYVYQAVSPYQVMGSAERDATAKNSAVAAAVAKAEAENKVLGLPADCRPALGNCPNTSAAKLAGHLRAEADRLDSIAIAAEKRLRALREASARARADPHYVYQAVSPYAVISSAEKDATAKRAAAAQAAAKAEAAAAAAHLPHHCIPRGCPNTPLGNAAAAARANAERLRQIAEAAKKRLQGLREASARARSDPHYVYQAVSPYAVIHGAETAWTNAEKAAATAEAAADKAEAAAGC